MPCLFGRYHIPRNVVYLISMEIVRLLPSERRVVKAESSTQDTARKRERSGGGSGDGEGGFGEGERTLGEGEGEGVGGDDVG